MRSQFVPIALVAGALVAQAPTPQRLVVPAAYAAIDAPSFCWLPGACADVRQQTLVGASHLGAAVGHGITALELRRTAANEAFAGGTANLVVTLSISPRDPLTSSPMFAENVGTDPVTVFQGSVALPTSPAVTGNVAWSAANIVRIAFQQPFAYAGGTLCIDITGTKVTGQTADWWMADAAFEDISGSVAEIGPGCGAHTNALGQWSFASPRSLLAGGFAHLSAYGPPGSLGVAVLGDAAPWPIALSSLGMPSPDCFAYLASMSSLMIAPFAPQTHPLLQSLGGSADLLIRIPNQSWVLGAQVSAQWLELSQLQSSNAIRLTVGACMPTLDMAMLDGVPNDPEGNLTVFMAHVFRFEIQ